MPSNPSTATKRASQGTPDAIVAPAARCRSLRRDHGAAHAAVLPPLQEGSLVVQGREGLLEPLDLGLATSLTLLVRLRLRDAAGLDLAVVVQDGRELAVGRLTVRGQLGNVAVQRLRLLCLVLDVGLLCGR